MSEVFKMARFSGIVGYVENAESSPGVWTETVTERSYYGDVNRAIRRLENGSSVNDNITVNNEISIVADPYAREHFFSIRYATWQGTKWKVTNVEVLYPRLILTLGGVYHGDT